MNIFKKWQDRDTSPKNRVLALLIGALVFPVLIPILFFVFSPGMDRALGFPSFSSGWGNILAGALLTILGGGVAMWSIVTQIELASGTPFPMLPTKKLLIAGPFKYCRNPMTLGTVLAYGGIAVGIGSYSALLSVAVIAAILIGYLKLIEEKELQLRFGEEYLAYTKNTPFMIPISIKKKDADR